MTDEQRAAEIKALLREKRGYELRGLTDRATAIDQRLAELGAEAKPPRRRYERRVVK